uniref:F-box domain-containing protein n=1 Tax=Mycena chlorophos TaxID=658473 RepID=A0ABQ0LSL8_MYCCL|nr:predicted protein [Mycena chlorophos]
MSPRDPTLSLPVELCAHIFRLYLEKPRREPTGTRHPRIPDSPFLLGAVCRQWRALCLSEPKLWDAINIYPPQSLSVADYMDLVELWLARSKDRPLHIYCSRKLASQYVYRLIDVCVRPHAPRVKDLRIRLAEEHVPQFKDAIVFGLPLLSRLSIGYRFASREAARLSWGDTLGNSSRLTELSLAGLHLDILKLPLPQITLLYLANLSVSDCVRILEQTRALQTLHAQLSHLGSGPRRTETGHTSLTLSLLHTLTLVGDSEAQLLARLTLPHLTSLSIHAFVEEGRDNLNRLAARSKWALQTLNIQGVLPAVLLECLQGLPTLESVAMEYRPLPSAEDLPFATTATDFLPRLRDVHLRIRAPFTNVFRAQIPVSQFEAFANALAVNLSRRLVANEGLKEVRVQFKLEDEEQFDAGMIASADTLRSLLVFGGPLPTRRDAKVEVEVIGKE